MLKNTFFACALLHVLAAAAGAEMPAAPAPELPVTAETEEPAWVNTLERIASGVVSIRVDSTRAFDTEWNSSTQATGFVVDAERGLILTNRHVVTPGPVTAEAVFLNNEEVRLTAIYRDPVHDFGFFSYDPADLRYIEPAELPLVPGAAGIGREIRVVGNDAGEQLSILSGTIARLDRSAPEYGRGKYNDFNTFYYQAASGTSGGSSGSPVVNIEGEVVALNAGANNSAASSFFLPLDRIQRALELLQRGDPVTRGTLQTTFARQTYDELVRLGLRPETEALVRDRHPAQTGMLTVQQVIAGSPAAGRLQPGDILLRVNGELITEFVPLAAILDNHVGREVAVETERGGRKIIQQVPVTDLHAITPDEFLEFGDAIVNNLSYQQARHYNRATDAVYVADPGYMLARAAVPRGAIITGVGGEPVHDIGDLETILAGLADRDRTTVRFRTIEDPRNSAVRSIEMDRTWFPARRCARNDETGLWPCRDLEDGPAAAEAASGSTRFAPQDDPRAGAIAPSLVMVNFDLPYTVSGVADRHYYGTGLIVDTERGLVVVDRNTVPVAMGDVAITLAGSLQIRGTVEFIHPLHNLAVVSYDPDLIGDTPVRSASFDTSELGPGDLVWAVGLKSDHQVAYQASTVASVDPLSLPLSRTMRFRDSNLEGISLVNAPGDFDGVLVKEDGSVAAMWSSFAIQSGGESSQFSRGIGSALVSELVDVVTAGRPIYSLEIEVAYAPLFAARKLGLGEDWLRKLEQHNPHARRALSVKRIVAGSPAASQLQNGDMVLAIDGRLVSTFRELERAVQKPTVEVTIWRNGAERTLRIDTVALDGTGIQRAVSWAGALLQDPHRPMAAQRGIEPSGVYVAFFNYGSPATRYGLHAGRRIVAVDETETPDLEAFVAAVAGKQDRASVRLKTVTWNGAVEVITLKLDNQYWPAYEIRRSGSLDSRTANRQAFAMLNYPEIDPVIFSIGVVKVRWYGLMYVIGFVLAWWLARRRAAAAWSPIRPAQVDDLIFYSMLGVIIGGRLGYCLVYGWDSLWSDPLYIFKITEGGMSFHGGLVGVMAALWLYSRKLGCRFWLLADFVVPLGPLGLGFGRIGNFINGELWGKPTDVPWSFNVNGQSLHPSQLYEALLEGFVLFAIVWLFSAKPRPVGAVSGLFLVGYGVFRFFVEFYRVPDAHLGYLALSWVTMGQVLSLPMILLGAALLWLAYRGRDTRRAAA